MIGFIARKFFGTKNEREVRRLEPLVSVINDKEKALLPLSNQELQAISAQYRERAQNGEDLDSILPDAFALVREASRRVLGMRHFDVQLIGGMVLHQGKIAEMKTGEGKTLCATLPVYLNALPGKGVHLVTVNDYLARRDAEWMGTLYSFLGLRTGVVVHGISNADRKAAYEADITYGQNNEFGFDYLRDNMKLDLNEKVQRPHAYAIVDEVDSILIDEARTPLIISGPGTSPTETYYVADKIVRKLRLDEHYTIEAKSKNATLTEDGVTFIEQLLQIDNLYDPANIELVHHTQQSLKAHAIMQRDVDYVVRDNQIIIVDEFTGRLMPGRRWSDGLHQAVEAKEGVTIAKENQTLATITFQNYFRMYKKLAGMTGTADTEAVEFKKIYNLDVVIVPTNRPMVRKDHPDVIYRSEKGKFKAVCKEIAGCYERGQPILVGTSSIAKSELVSELLKKQGIPHHVLNAKHHEHEAEIVAQAGRYKAVTISTNMAGRGTDIVLGGNPEFLAAAEAGTKDPSDPTFQELLVKFRAQCAEEKAKVLALGGLHIMGTERHESRRIDNQLRGRSGRQGDPGSSRFYVALDDELMKRFGGERLQAIMTRIGMQEDDVVAGSMLSKRIEAAQKRVEGYNFDIRKHLLEYDDVMNKQREVIYSLRGKILADNEIDEQIDEMIPDVIEEIIITRASESEPVRNWDIEGIIRDINRTFNLEIDSGEFLQRQEGATRDFAQEMFNDFKQRATERIQVRRDHFGHERMRKLERIVMLQAMDYFWQEHLTNIDQIKDAIFLRGYSQKNPLYEYQREAFELFASMWTSIRMSVLQHLFVPELPSEAELDSLEAKEREREQRQVESAQTIHQAAPTEAAAPREQDAAAGLNRAQRRQIAPQPPSRQSIVESPDAYAPSAVSTSVTQKQKKDAARKKAKLAKKARRKGR